MKSWWLSGCLNFSGVQPHLAPQAHELVWVPSGEEYLFIVLTLVDPCEASVVESEIQV